MSGSIIELTEARPLGPACFVVSWEALEKALTVLASPQKAEMVPETISALRQLQLAMLPSKLLVEILAATAWITDDTDLAGGSEGGVPMT